MTTMIPDPTDPTVWFIGSAAEAEFGMQVSSAIVTRVHPATQCAGRPCVVHNPSDHHMRDWNLNFRADKGQMERLCPEHNVGHPDPDDMLYQVEQGREWMGIHGCCGCCRTND